MNWIDNVTGDSPQDTKSLKTMASEAVDYIQSYSWCPTIENAELALGVGGVVAVFRFDFEELIDGSDKMLWVIVGDLPSAYLVVEDDDPTIALENYCELMNDWVGSVLNPSSSQDVFPVRTDKTREVALQLATRIQFLRDKIIPSFK